MHGDIPTRPPGRNETIAAHRATGGRVAAVLPIHYPRELLTAFGFLPVEVWGPPRVAGRDGDAHLQAYTCSIVRSALSFLMGEGAGQTDAIVVPHACDSLQGLGSLLLDFAKPTVPVFPFYLPRAAREVDRVFLARELGALYDKLAALTGLRPDDAALRAAAHVEEQADAALRALAVARERLPLSDRAYYEVVRAREYLPASVFMARAQAVLEAARPTAAEAAAERGGGVPLILSGIVPEPMDLFDVLREIGARVVADDFAACGRRLYPEGRGDQPLRRMADRILDGPPDPMRGNPIAERVAALRREAARTGARGVVIYTVKFCEPELFDVPLLRQGLEKAGLPSLVLEIDVSEALGGQTRTRLEAFVEMLS